MIFGEFYPYPVSTVELAQPPLRLCYLKRGKGKQKLLFLHGLASNLNLWEPAIKLLENRFECYALDLPGHGQSETADYPYGLEFYVRAVEGFIEAMGFEQIALVGHSMGALIAAKIAQKHTEVIRQLILIAPTCIESFSIQQRSYLNGWYKNNLTPHLHPSELHYSVRQNFYQMPTEAIHFVDYQQRFYSETNFDLFRLMILRSVESMLKQNLNQLLETIPQPVLLMIGEQDKIVPNKQIHPHLNPAKLIAQAALHLKDVETSVVPACGHYLPFEQPQSCAQAIFEFYGIGLEHA